MSKQLHVPVQREMVREVDCFESGKIPFAHFAFLELFSRYIRVAVFVACNTC